MHRGKSEAPGTRRPRFAHGAFASQCRRRPARRLSTIPAEHRGDGAPSRQVLRTHSPPRFLGTRKDKTVMSRFILTLTTAVIAAATLAACANMTPDMEAQERMTATAVLAPTRGNTATGTVTFEQIGDHVVVNAKVAGLAPNS